MKHIPTFGSFLNEATDKSLDKAIEKIIDEVKNGYGWIDPEYVGYAINSIDKSIDFESKETRDQIYQALIDAKVLNFAARHIPLKKGSRITNIGQIIESAKEEVSEKVSSGKLYDFFLYIIATAAQYTSNDLGHLGGQTPRSMKDAIDMVLDEIPKNKKEEFKKAAEAYAKANKLEESIVNEAVNPEMDRKVKKFIKGIADLHDYSEEDAVRATMEALKRLGYENLIK